MLFSVFKSKCCQLIIQHINLKYKLMTCLSITFEIINKYNTSHLDIIQVKRPMSTYYNHNDCNNNIVKHFVLNESIN